MLHIDAYVFKKKGYPEEVSLFIASAKKIREEYVKVDCLRVLIKLSFVFCQYRRYFYGFAASGH